MDYKSEMLWRRIGQELTIRQFAPSRQSPCSIPPMQIGSYPVISTGGGLLDESSPVAARCICTTTGPDLCASPVRKARGRSARRGKSARSWR